MFTGTGIIMMSLSILLLGGITVAGIFYSRDKSDSTEDYFSAGRNVGLASTIATFIAFAAGTGMLFSPAESAYFNGFSALMGYSVAISLAFFVFSPISRRIKKLIPAGHSIPEYIKARYGNGMYITILLVTMLYMFILLTINLVGASLALRYMGDVPIPIGVLIIGIPMIIYTSYGGLSASIFTDGLQAIFIIPIVFITGLAGVLYFGGGSSLYGNLMEQAPEQLNILNAGGLKFGVMIIIAVMAAELLNQSLWQRVYSGKDGKTVARGLKIAGLIAFPMAFISGLFGLMVVSMGIELPHPSVATAIMIARVLPEWIIVIFALAIVAAASSTGDNALNAFSSLMAVDVLRPLFPAMDRKKLLSLSRIITIAFGVGAMLLAFRAPSVLFLLLVADLVCSAALIPVFAGLYMKRISGRVAMSATILGIVGGLPLFRAGENLYSFLTAIILSGLTIFIGSRVFPINYDFNRLQTDIKTLDHGQESLDQMDNKTKEGAELV